MAVIEEKPMQRQRAIERGEKERAGILCTGPYAYVLLDICKLVAGTAGLTGWLSQLLLAITTTSGHALRGTNSFQF